MTDRSMGETAGVHVDEATTDRYGLPCPRGTDGLGATRQARAWYLRAKRTRDPASIAGACLVLVDNLLDRHRVLAASWAIEDALAVLATTEDAIGTADAAWNLQLALAALYERLGDQVRARRTAQLAFDEARRADSSEGRQRCRALLEELATRRASAPDEPEVRRSA